VCVATDVAARGIDIADLELVIHAELPTNRDVLQHRSGRTGRAGRKGTCVILVPHPRRRRADMLLKSAKIEATWQAPPSAEDIRAQDEARLIAAVAPAAEAVEEDMTLVRTLMEQRSVEDIAAAYVRLARKQMPAPEDLAESEPEPRGAYVPAHERAPEAPRPGFEDAVWFRIDIGRNKNAEARWVLPMICRRGHATKRDIGAIRVFERETRFQVSAEAVERFEAAAAKGDSDGGHITRVPDNAPPPQGARPTPSGRSKPYARRDDAGGGERAPKPYVKREDSGGERPAKKPYVKRDDAGGERPAKPFVKRDRNAEPRPVKQTWAPMLNDVPAGGPGKPKKAKKPASKKGKPNG
jgi:ATP-dependent RNA helicase DeaD